METRDFLNKIRKLQDEKKKISLTYINEQENDEGQDVTVEEQKEEENNFKDKVSNLCKFDKIVVYPENVKWSGFLLQEKIHWSYSLIDEIGCYIYADADDAIQLTDPTLQVINKIRVYYDVWSDEWSGRLTGISKEEEGGEEAAGGLGF